MSMLTLTSTFISAPTTAVDRNLSKWHSECKEQIGSIPARGTANCVLVISQSDDTKICCMIVVLPARENQKSSSYSEVLSEN